VPTCTAVYPDEMRYSGS